jgi:hypothetical protein
MSTVSTSPSFLNLLPPRLFFADPVAPPSKACVCGRSLAGTAGSNPAGNMLSLESVVCRQIEVSLSCPEEWLSVIS